MTARNHNHNHSSLALSIAVVLGAAGLAACDGFGDADGRSLEGASSPLTLGESGDEGSSGDIETTGEGTTGEVGTTGDGEGCTLTQGYWKNHTAGSKNKSQQKPWPISEDTELCGMTWLEILKTAPKGDAWFIVAHQWIAASLNVAAGAVPPADVAAALTAAEGYLFDCEITDNEHDLALDSKDVLDAFNNGEIGPGHCGDDPGDTGADTGEDTTTTGGDETGGDTTGEPECVIDCPEPDPLPIPG